MHSLSAFEQGARCADEHVGHAKSTHADTSSVRWTGQVCKSGGSVTQAVLVLGGGGGRRLSLFFFPLRSCGSVLIFPVCFFFLSSTESIFVFSPVSGFRVLGFRSKSTDNFLIEHRAWQGWKSWSKKKREKKKERKNTLLVSLMYVLT